MYWKADVAVIGAGQMGSALIRGLIRAGYLEASRIAASDMRQEVLEALRDELGIQAILTREEIPRLCPFLILAVKPQDVPVALGEIGPYMGSDHLLLSIAAGIPIGFLEGRLPSGVRVIRAMPNTPCLLGLGCTALAPGTFATQEDISRAFSVFRALGEVVEVPERLMDAVTALSGSGPAYLFLFAEALIEAGARMGLPWATSKTLVYQTLRGASEMLLRTEEPPSVLRQKVSSPGGTTLAGLAALETGGLRGSILRAVEEATRRGRELAQEIR